MHLKLTILSPTDISHPSVSLVIPFLCPSFPSLSPLVLFLFEGEPACCYNICGGERVRLKRKWEREAKQGLKKKNCKESVQLCSNTVLHMSISRKWVHVSVWWTAREQLFCLFRTVRYSLAGKTHKQTNTYCSQKAPKRSKGEESSHRRDAARKGEPSGSLNRWDEPSGSEESVAAHWWQQRGENTHTHQTFFKF